MSSSKKTGNQNSTLQEEIRQKIEMIRLIENDLPLVVIIINVKDSTVVHMSERGRNILNVSMEELIRLGPAYHSRFFNVEESNEYVPRILEMLQVNDDEHFISFFQQVRPSSKHNWTWYLSSAKIFMRDENGDPLLTLVTATPIDPRHNITSKVERLLQENNMLRKKRKVFESLTKREKSVLTLMAMGSNSADIANKLHISENTAATHRRNIKKKLDAQSNYDITVFAQAFDLI